MKPLGELPSQQMTPCQATRCYATYEQREDAFRHSVFSLIPRKYLGPGTFWSDFQSITASFQTRLPNLGTIACITSNPRDCLALGTPWQELSAAILRTRQHHPHFSETPESVAAAFDLTDQLMQPVRTLSGGEAVKLALAKTWIVCSCCQKLVAASPCNWLSQSNRILFDRVITRYLEQDKEVALFSLDGEDANQPVSCSISGDNGIDFEIVFQQVQIPLGDPLSLDESNRVMARVSDDIIRLISPCLIQGDNGQGKSLIAKILSESIPCQGRVEIHSDPKASGARLIFQDMTAQTLFRSFNQIVSSTGKLEKNVMTGIYQEIMRMVSLSHTRAGLTAPVKTDLLPTGWGSLLELKVALAAARLLHQPSALILDEPDWGLSQFAAGAFVSGVIAAAHVRHVPLILITHKPWWCGIAKSGLQAVKSPMIKNAQSQREFWIGLNRI